MNENKNETKISKIIEFILRNFKILSKTYLQSK